MTNSISRSPSNEKENLEIIIQGPIPSKKNSKKIIPDWRRRRVRLITAPDIKKWEDDIRKNLSNIRGIKGAVKMTIVIYNADRRKRDLDNQLCSINDALKGILFEEDDGKILQDIHIKWGGIDKNNPRAEISISPIDNSNKK